MDTTEQQLLALLRSALWSRPVDVSLFEGGTSWRALFRLAEKQTVVGLVYDAVLTLPQALQPDGDLLRTAHLHTIRTAQSHQLLNTTLTQLVQRLQAEGFRPVLLKGQGVALNYPHPLRRNCGDIDLYIGEPDYPRVCRLLHQWNMPGEDATESIQHLHFSYNGVHLEIHRIAGVLFHSRRNRLFRQWSDELLQGDTCRTVRIDQTEILLPPVRFDAFFIFYHTYKHFLTGGVGLRQLCDWALYLHAFSRQIDRPALLQDLNRFHLLRPWQIMGQIAVRHLGLPQEEFPFFLSDGKAQRRAEAMMELILQSGNFGFHDPQLTARPDGYLAGKMHSFRWVHRRLWRVLPLCPADTLSYYRTFLTIGIAQLYKDKFTTQNITGTTA